MIVWNPRTAFTAAVPSPAASGSAIASKRLIPIASACVTRRCSDVSPIPRRGRFAMRMSETASLGLWMTERYAIASLISARS